MRHIAGYSLLDKRRNYGIWEEFKADAVKMKLEQCKQKWLNHVISVEDMRHSK